MPDVDEYRLGEVERKVDGLIEHSVSREWLDERIGRLEDTVRASGREAARARAVLERDVEEIREEARARRRAVYTALVGSLVAIVVAAIQAVPM